MLKWVAAYCEMRWRVIPANDDSPERRELFAIGALGERGYDVFCPFERVTKQQKVGGITGRGVTRAITIDEPVFAPYAFVRTDDFLAASKVPGVGVLVASRGTPLAVPDRVVDRLRDISSEKGLVVRDLTRRSFHFRGNAGDMFEFAGTSPLRGLRGRISSIARLDETGEIRAWVNMLGGEREIDVPVDQVGSFGKVALAA